MNPQASALVSQRRARVLEGTPALSKDATLREQYDHFTGKLFKNESMMNRLRDEALAYASTHGVITEKDHATGTLVHAPMSLLPSYIPKGVYETAAGIATDFNLLVDRVSRDTEFLRTTLADAGKADDFVRRQLQVLETVAKEGGDVQPLRLGCHRSDYMVHNEEQDDGTVVQTPLQVELNTIASSFGCLSSQIAKMHRHLVTREQAGPTSDLATSTAATFLGAFDASDPEAGGLRINRAMEGLTKGLATAARAHPAFGKEEGVVVMLVQPGETNSADQRLLEYTLWEQYQVPMVRLSLADLGSRAKIDPDTKHMTVDGLTVLVAYFRSGYTPRDYTGDLEWEAVMQLERSTAVKCPCMAYHLAGTKKVQQELAQPGVLERFVDGERAARLRTCFAGLWGLERDDEATKAIIAKAIAKPDDYVLKPQREGGGNNLWGQEIVDKLSSATAEERGAFILMQRIKPKEHRAALMRAGEVSLADCVHELGIYAAFLGDGKGGVLLNQFCGHLLRTKKLGVNEGGVASGYACINSPYIV